VQIIEIPGERGTSEVVIGCGQLERLPELVAERGLDRPSAVVTNTTVAPLYGSDAALAVGTPPPFELPDGEAFKRWEQVEAIVNVWLDEGLHRKQSVLGVGGGVVTDTVGFAAAVYLRGIEWLAVPTTLLGMVDAAIGGKTGVNLDRGKNLVGAFWAPRMVVADPLTLASLPSRELRAGMAEVVKAAWIGDHQLLDLLERPIDGMDALPRETWEELVWRSICVKASIVERDERESGARKALNLGHTLGHGLEAATAYDRFLHGEAVVWGMRAAAALARHRGLLSVESMARYESALNALGTVPGIEDLDGDQILGHIARDKKRDDLGVGWVLPTDDGVVLDQRVTSDELRKVLADLRTANPVH
jgi:3-dehydroquinate synthase